LQHHHAADKKPRKHDNRQRSDANHIHLLERIEPIVRGRKNVSDLLKGEERIVLHRED